MVRRTLFRAIWGFRQMVYWGQELGLISKGEPLRTVPRTSALEARDQYALLLKAFQRAANLVARHVREQDAQRLDAVVKPCAAVMLVCAVRPVAGDPETEVLDDDGFGDAVQPCVLDVEGVVHAHLRTASAWAVVMTGCV